MNDLAYRFFPVEGFNHPWVKLEDLGAWGSEIISRSLHPFTNALFSWIGPMTVSIITSLLVWAALWYVCYWLYKNRLFIKI